MRVSDILDLLSMYDRAILKIYGRKIWEGRAYTMSEKFGKYFIKSIHPPFIRHNRNSFILNVSRET